MATQITHIVLAERVWQEFPDQYNKPAFIIGTTFPDIRYLGDVTRDRTHYYDLDFNDVRTEENAFTAGQKLHCLIDLVREQYVVEQGIYTYCPNSPLTATALKFVEDELLYPTLSNWPEIAGYYDMILPEERTFPIPEDHLQLWHTTIRNYISQPPSDSSRLTHGQALGLTPEKVASFNSVIAKMREIAAVREYVDRLYKKLPELLTQWEK